MKTLILFLLLITFQTNEPYYVITVKGTVSVNKSNLKRGNKISSNDQLTFHSKEAQVVVISPNKGRFTLTAQKAKKNFKGEFIALLKEAIIPPKKYKTTGTRAVTLSSFEDLRYYFAASTDNSIINNFLIVDKGKYLISPSFLTMNRDSSFYINYTYHEKNVYRELGFNQDTLFIDNSVYIDGKKLILPSEAIDTKLYFLDKARKEKRLITRFKPVFVERGELLEEMKIILDVLKGQDNQLIYKQYILPHLVENYGVPDELFIKKVITEEFGINVF